MTNSLDRETEEGRSRCGTKTKTAALELASGPPLNFFQ